MVQIASCARKLTQGWRIGLLVPAIGLLVPVIARADFQLSSPPSWIVETENGDPQSMGPCGVAPSACYTTTGAVTTFVAGQRIAINWVETVPIDGWYRIAISYNDRTDIPDPAVSADDAGVSVDAANTGDYNYEAGLGVNSMALPILADGVFAHAADEITVPWNYTYILELPTTPCANCTLQVIQFLNHRTSEVPGNPSGYFSHHCANITILPDDGTSATASFDGVVTFTDGGGPTAACPPPGDDGGSNDEGGSGGSSGAGGSSGDGSGGSMQADASTSAGGASGAGGSPGTSGSSATGGSISDSGGGTGGSAVVDASLGMDDAGAGQPDATISAADTSASAGGCGCVISRRESSYPFSVAAAAALLACMRRRRHSDRSGQGAAPHARGV